MSAPKPALSPRLLHMCFNPTKPDEFYNLYQMVPSVPGDAAGGGDLRIERLRLKDKPPVPRDPKAPPVCVASHLRDISYH